MKKLIALLLALVMLLGLVACGAGEEAPTAEAPATDGAADDAPATDDAADAARPYEGVELSLWLAPYVSAEEVQAYTEEVLVQFTEETGATVEVQVNDWTELHAKYLTAFMAGNAADVLYAYNGMLPKFLEGGFLADVSEYYTEEEIADEYFWTGSMYSDGKVYGVPYVGGGSYRCYVYNMDVLAECGVTELPTTWEEFEAVCEKVHAGRPDLYTFLLPFTGNSNCLDYGINYFVLQAGGKFFNDELNQMTINTPETQKAFEFELGLFEKGYISEDALGMTPEVVEGLFRDGQAAITVVNVPQNRFADTDFEWMASTDLGDVDRKTFNPVDVLCLNEASENKEAAVALIKFLNSTEVRDKMNKEVYQSAQLRASDIPCELDPRVEEAFAHPERSYFPPIASEPSEYITSLMNMQQQIFSGEISIEEGLAQVQSEIDAIMGVE